jgi:hypothetical protein
MSKPEDTYESIRAKTASLIRCKLFHPQKENDEIVALADELAELWPAWVKSGNLETEVNTWLRKLNLSHTGLWHEADSNSYIETVRFVSSRRASGQCRFTFLGSHPRKAHVPPNGRWSMTATLQPTARIWLLTT